MPPCPKPPKRVKTRKRIRAVGDKGASWHKTREQIKTRFEMAGITQCELRYSGCWRNNALTFAHSKKRRHITSQQELEEVALACLHCHQIAENRRDMTEIIRGVIYQRKVVI